MEQRENPTMATILVLNSSVYGDASVTRTLVAETVRRLQAADPDARVLDHDLGATPLPHLSTASIAGVRGTPATPLELETRAVSDILIAELHSADTIVIGSPMYNFSIATGLRAWFDYVLRAGLTFKYSETGPEGLVTGKSVIVATARGGMYTEGPTKPYDFQEPYLRHLLGFMGLTDVTFVHAEKIGYGPEAREAAIEQARAQLGALVDQHGMLSPA
jgi:FMN-dependent NADH-azoreductase